MKLNTFDFELRKFYESLNYQNGAKKEFNLTPNQNKQDRLNATIKFKIFNAIKKYSQSKNIKMTLIIDEILNDFINKVIEENDPFDFKKTK